LVCGISARNFDAESSMIEENDTLGLSDGKRNVLTGSMGFSIAVGPSGGFAGLPFPNSTTDFFVETKAAFSIGGENSNKRQKIEDNKENTNMEKETVVSGTTTGSGTTTVSTSSPRTPSSSTPTPMETST